MKTQVLLLFIIMQNLCYGQYSNNVWCFGDSARIDFANGIATINSSVVDSRGTCTSIADSNNNLLFYTAPDPIAFTTPGYFKRGMIYNSVDSTMENGDSIISTAWYNEHLIVPNPADINKFYLFNLGETLYEGLYYNEIDLSYNNGNGKLLSKNNALSTGNRMFDGISATKHGNGRDWWVVSKPIFVDPTLLLSDTFYVYLITPDSIHPPTKQRIGTGRGWSLGNMTFSNNGSKLCYNNLYDIIEVYDFDRCTGLLSNANIVYNASPGGAKAFWGSAFSPNDSLLYASSYNVNPSPLYQFNIYTHTMNIIAQINSITPGIGRSPGALRLAPDGKIYMTTAAGDTLGGVAYPYDDTTYYAENMYLGVIENPNIQGAGCNFNPYGFYLGGKRSYWGLPNNPNYELGALVGSGCDTLTNLGPTLTLPEGEGVLRVWPNPARDEVWFSLEDEPLPNPPHKGGNNLRMETVEVVNVLGEVVLRLDDLRGKNKIDLKNFSGGVYFLKVKTEKGFFSEKFLRE